MKTASFIRLLSLAAIWGSSFIFLRVLSPVIGPFATVTFRLLLAGAVLVAYFKFIGFDPEWRRFFRHYLIIGLLNSALPFVLYSFAALYMPSSYEVILNSSTPLFGAVFSALWLNENLTLKKLCGLLISAAGVALIANPGGMHPDPQFGIAVCACLAGAACYGLSGVYIKKFATAVKPMAFAGCSQLVAGIALLPSLLFMHPSQPITAAVALNILALALLCSSVAYLLYYRLIADEGPTTAYTVTFLMPLFGMFWASLFLKETITLQMLAGCALIIAGVCLVLNVISLPQLAAKEPQ